MRFEKDNVVIWRHSSIFIISQLYLQTFPKFQRTYLLFIIIFIYFFKWTGKIFVLLNCIWGTVLPYLYSFTQYSLHSMIDIFLHIVHHSLPIISKNKHIWISWVSVTNHFKTPNTWNLKCVNMLTVTKKDVSANYCEYLLIAVYWVMYFVQLS